MRKLYAAVRYTRSSMQREIKGISHSIAALRRQHEGARIFQIEMTPIPGSHHGLKDIKFVGKEIRELDPAPVATITPRPEPKRPIRYRRKRAA